MTLATAYSEEFNTEPKSVEGEAVVENQPLPKIYYAGRGGYAIEHGGKFIPLTCAEAVVQHLKPYLGKKGDYDGALCNIRLNNFVSYIGPVAGIAPGLHTSEDMEGPFLVTSGPKIIEGTPGDFPFIEAFLAELLDGQDQALAAIGWLRQARSNLVAGKRRPLPAAALVGPKECGKSLFIELARRVLGGRSANALRALNGSTNFNADALGAELLVIDDEIASRDPRARISLAQGLKKQLFAASVRVEGKYRDAVTMRPIHAVVLAVNSEPENMMVLPALDDSLEDKISLFLCERARLDGMDSPDEISGQLNAELPAFIYYLETSTHPEQLRNRRTGVAAWHNPELRERLRSMEIEERFRELIAQCSAVSFQITTEGAWRGSAAELAKALMEDEQTRHSARSILTWSDACGAYLGKLKKAGRARISSSVVNGYTRWRIESLGEGGV
jgi:hypothetical protein